MLQIFVGGDGFDRHDVPGGIFSLAPWERGGDPTRQGGMFSAAKCSTANRQLRKFDTNTIPYLQDAEICP